MAADWYVSINGERRGPLSPKDIRSLAASGQLKREDHVWKEGLADWVLATEVKGLFAGPPPPPQPQQHNLSDDLWAQLPTTQAPIKPSRHPEVQRFVDKIHTIETPREFQYFAEPSRVWGTAEGSGGSLGLSIKLFAISALLALIGGPIAGPIVLPIAGLLFFASLITGCISLLQPMKEADSLVKFEIDFSGERPRWHSNDEVFWKNV
jgi:hypothetical protein